MEKKTKLQIVLGLCVIVCLWFMFFMVPLIFTHTHTDYEIVNFFNVSFTAATALFTGIAFTITYISLYQQNKNLNRQINMDVFSDTIRLLMDSDRYLQSRQYIYSKDFYRDIEELKRIRGGESNFFGLNDFRDIIRSLDSLIPLVDKETKERLCKSYEKIIYFCSRMEYLGFMYENKAAVSLILDYYGHTIVESYNILKPLLESDRKDDNTEEMYVHYTRLYQRAKEKISIKTTNETI